MKILKDIPITISAKDVIASQSRGKKLSESLISAAQKCIDIASNIIQPVIGYTFVTIEQIKNSQVWITWDKQKKIKLNLGPHADLLKKATFAIVSVHSIGQKIDDKVKALNDQGNYLDAYLLDCAGVVALNEVGKKVNQIIEEKAEQENLSVGAYLSPGSLEGWDLLEQKKLCSILNLGAVGLALTDACILVPFKSVSTLIGAGPEFKSKKVGSMCIFCNHRESCWRRKSNHTNS